MGIWETGGVVYGVLFLLLFNTNMGCYITAKYLIKSYTLKIITLLMNIQENIITNKS